MRKVLIISEQDISLASLTRLYDSIYSHEKKELTLCSMELSVCQSGGQKLPYSVPKRSFSTVVPGLLNEYIALAKPKKRLQVNSCEEVIKFISKNKINTVLVPIYIYDTSQTNKINEIVARIKRNRAVEVIGYYM